MEAVRSAGVTDYSGQCDVALSNICNKVHLVPANQAVKKLRKKVIVKKIGSPERAVFDF